MRRDKITYEEKEKRNKRKIIGKILVPIIIIITVIFIFSMKNSNILPLKYMVIISILISIFATVLLVIFNTKKSKKAKIITGILLLLYTAVLSIAITYLFKLSIFLNDITASSDYETKNFSVIVLKDSDYSELSDLDGEELNYVLSEDEESINEKLEEEISKYTNCIMTKADEISVVKDALLNEDIAAMIIDDSQKTIIEEETPEFYDKIKVIYTFSIKMEVETISKDVQVSEEPFNIYISGIDTYGDITTVSRSDVNIVATVNPKTHQILLTTIPRDSYVQLNGTKRI